MKLLIFVVTAGMLLAACAGGGRTGGGFTQRRGRIPHPTGAGDLVLRADEAGGFLPPGSQLDKAVPHVSVYGDGRVIVRGPATEQVPGPAMPNVQEFRVDQDGVQRILAAARDAGVLDDHPPNYGRPEVTDLDTTTVVVDAAGKRHEVSAYGLGFREGLTGSERDNRKRLEQLVSLASDQSALHSFVVSNSAHRYLPTAVAVLILATGTNPAAAPAPAVHDWPLGDLAAAGEPTGNGSGTRCLVVTGDDLTRVLAAANPARATDAWRANGATYTLAFRPLLPDERGCANVASG
jgi:hypothetical protein